MTTDTKLLLLALLSEARDLIAEAMDAHIYDTANGEQPDGDCGYADFLRRVERVLEREQPQERQPFTVVATYATPSGRCGRWEGRVLATADTVYGVAEAALRRQRTIGGKMDMQAFPAKAAEDDGGVAYHQRMMSSSPPFNTRRRRR